MIPAKPENFWLEQRQLLALFLAVGVAYAQQGPRGRRATCRSTSPSQFSRLRPIVAQKADATARAHGASQRAV